MTVKHLVVVLVLASCGGPDPGEDALDERALDIAAGTEPKITSVTTDDGFTQVRQNATVSLVIAGKRLAGTTSVTVGSFFVTIDSVAADEVRVTVFTDSQPPGRLDVSVTTSAGTATKLPALELTPFVVSPTAVTGHGTYQSPMNLCDSELEFTGSGSIVQLLAGTHHCDRLVFLGAGSTVLGGRGGGTILTGTETGGFGIVVAFGAPEQITTIRDLTFQPPLAGTSIELSGGNLVVERVVDAGGIISFSDGFAAIDHYTYEGEGTGVSLNLGRVSKSTIRHCGSGDGIRVAVDFPFPNGGNDVTLDDVVVEDCQRGLVIGAGSSGTPVPISVEVLSSRFIDNAVGIRVNDGFTSLHDVVIRGDDTTPRASTTGISISRGDVTMVGGKITGQASVGIEAFAHSNGNSHTATRLDVSGAQIVGGACGIDFSGLDNALLLHNSTIRAQTQAALRISAVDSTINLGGQAGPSDPGNNKLSVVSGFAIADDRQGTDGFHRYIFAAGNTLNGVSFDGQTIEGPAELAPYYRITDNDSGIQF